MSVQFATEEAWDAPPPGPPPPLAAEHDDGNGLEAQFEVVRAQNARRRTLDALRESLAAEREMVQFLRLLRGRYLPRDHTGDAAARLVPGTEWYHDALFGGRGHAAVAAKAESLLSTSNASANTRLVAPPAIDNQHAALMDVHSLKQACDDLLLGLKAERNRRRTRHQRAVNALKRAEAEAGIDVGAPSLDADGDAARVALGEHGAVAQEIATLAHTIEAARLDLAHWLDEQGAMEARLHAAEAELTRETERVGDATVFSATSSVHLAAAEPTVPWPQFEAVHHERAAVEARVETLQRLLALPPPNAYL